MSLNTQLNQLTLTQPNNIAIESEAGQLSFTQLQSLVDNCVSYFNSLEPYRCTFELASVS